MLLALFLRRHSKLPLNEAA